DAANPVSTGRKTAFWIAASARNRKSAAQCRGQGEYAPGVYWFIHLLVYPDDAGFFQLGVLLPDFAGIIAERNGLCLREIRRRPLSLGGGVTRVGEDAPLLRHRRIRCVCRMSRKLVGVYFTVDRRRAELRECRRGGK